MYVSTSKAKIHYGVSTDTLRRWSKTDKIDFILTKGNHRRYFIPNSQEEQKQNKENKNMSPNKFIYARVSSHKQKSDLQHQVQLLTNKFPNHTVIEDIGSGLNFRRKGLKTILDKLFRGNIKEVVVTSKDRLARFGFELIQDIFNRFDARLIIINEDNNHKQFEQELS